MKRILFIDVPGHWMVKAVELAGVYEREHMPKKKRGPYHGAIWVCHSPLDDDDAQFYVWHSASQIAVRYQRVPRVTKAA